MIPLGKITVADSSLLYRLTTANASGNVLLVQAVHGNGAGYLYVGKSTMVKSTGVGVIAELAPGQSIEIPLIEQGSQGSASDYYLTADNNADAAYASYG